MSTAYIHVHTLSIYAMCTYYIKILSMICTELYIYMCVYYIYIYVYRSYDIHHSSN